MLLIFGVSLVLYFGSVLFCYLSEILIIFIVVRGLHFPSSQDHTVTFHFLRRVWLKQSRRSSEGNSIINTPGERKMTLAKISSSNEESYLNEISWQIFSNTPDFYSDRVKILQDDQTQLFHWGKSVQEQHLVHVWKTQSHCKVKANEMLNKFHKLHGYNRTFLSFIKKMEKSMNEASVILILHENAPFVWRWKPQKNAP